MGIPLREHQEKFEKLLDFHRVYSVKYEQKGKNRLDPALLEVLRITSEHYKNLLHPRTIHSYVKTTLKDYM